jgi:hypothetical protein
LNRLISREPLFFRPGAKLYRKRSKAALIVLNDNGSENMGKAEEQLSSPRITQYWTHPYFNFGNIFREATRPLAENSFLILPLSIQNKVYADLWSLYRKYP